MASPGGDPLLSKKAKAPARATANPPARSSKTATPRTKTAKKPAAPRPEASTETRGRKNPADHLIQLTAEAQDFQDKLRLCQPKERQFILNVLEGHTQTQAAIKAGYAASRAPETASRMASYGRVKDALEAGYTAAGITPTKTLAFIAALANFDRSQIETVVHQRMLDHVERLAGEVLAEVEREILLTRSAIDELKQEKVDEAEIKPLQRRVLQLRLRKLDLGILLDRDEDATTIVEVERLQPIPLIDLKKARDLGLSRFIKGVERTKYGYKIETHDFMDGVDRAAKVYGLYKDTLHVANPDGTPLETVRNASPGDLATLLAAYDSLRQGGGS